MSEAGRPSREVASGDVVVLGLGVIGAAVARELAVRGFKVVMVDRGDPGTGSSGRCDGNVLVQTKHSSAMVELTQRSIEGFLRWQKDLPGSMHFHQDGSLVFFPDAPSREAGLRRASWLESQGVRLEVLDTAQVRDREPALDGPCEGGIDCLDDASVYPPFVVAELVKDALRRGATSLWPARATELVRAADGSVEGVRTDRGLVRATWVVNAMGVWAGSLAGADEVRCPIQPRQGTLVVTEPVSGIFRRSVTESGYLSLRANQSRDVHEHPVFVAERTFAGNLLIGSSRRFLGERTDVDPRLVQDIVARAIRFSSVLGRVMMIRSFAGLRPWTPDNLPLVGEVSDIPGYVLAAGHEGEGVGLSPVTADIVADVIEGSALRWADYLGLFDPDRFGVEGEAVSA